MSDSIGPVSKLLHAWAGGDQRARDELVPLVYHELRKRASGYLRHERPDHTLQATALVHEVFLRLAGHDRVAWQNRGHFYAVAAQTMRRILVDHAREHRAAKRPGAAIRVDLDDQIPAPDPPGFDILMLDEALSELSAMDARQGRIVELRYFGGLSEQEVADTLSVSRATVTREWKRARALSSNDSNSVAWGGVTAHWDFAHRRSSRSIFHPVSMAARVSKLNPPLGAMRW